MRLAVAGAEAGRGEAVMGDLVMVWANGQTAVMHMTLPTKDRDYLVRASALEGKRYFWRDGEDERNRPIYREGPMK